MPCRAVTLVAKLPAPILALALLCAALSQPAAHAQVVYNGTQNTIISGIVDGGQIGYGLAVDKSGNVFVSGMGQPTSFVLEYPKSNGYQYNGVFLDTDFGGTAYGSSAYSIAFDNSDYLYVPAPQNGYLGVWKPGSGGLSATAYSTFPIGVGFGLDGNMYMADNIDRDIYEIALNGGNGGNNGAIITPSCYPYSVAADSAGNVYVPCAPQVLKYTYQGVGNYSQSVVTSSLSDSGYLQLGITVDRNGVVYVCDSHNNRVLRETPKPGGGFLESVFRSGYNNPSGITLDNQGNLYISDTYNGNVDEISFVPSSFSPQTVGTPSGSQSYSFTIFGGTTVSQIAAVSGGQAGQDFSSTATCTPQTFASTTNCTVNVTFTPKAPGLREGAIVFYDGNGNSLLSLPISGTGTAPQIALNGNLSSSNLALPASTITNSVAVDAAGNLFVATHSINQTNFPTVAGNIVEYPVSGASYGTPVTVATLNYPFDLAIAPNGDLIVSAITTSNGSAIYDVPRTSTGYGAPVTVTSSGQRPFGVAVDSLGDIFYLTVQSGSATLFEIQKSINTFGSPIQIATGLMIGGGLAVDAANNLYVPTLPTETTSQNDASVIEYTAASNYQTSNTVATGLTLPSHIAVEPNGNLLIQNGSVQLIPATSSGFGPPVTAATAVADSYGLAVDRSGNIVTNNEENNLLQIFHRGGSSLAFAATPEGSASADSPKSVTIENFGNQPLDFSEISFPANFPEASAESTDCSTSALLAEGATCTLTFEFAPDVALASGQTALAVNGTGTVLTNSLNGSNAVNSVALTGTETKPIPTLSLAASSTTPVYGTPVTLTATVAGGVGMAAAAPTGTVGFYFGSIALGTATLTANGETSTASITTAAGALPGGPDAIYFHYTGDQVYAAGSSSMLTATVSPATPAATLSVAPPSITPNTQATLKATIVGSVPSVAPTGTVSFNYTGAGAPGGAVLNTVALSGGTASITQLLPPGQGVVSVTYSGNSNYAGVTSSLVPINVTALTAEVLLTPSVNSLYAGGSVTLKAVVLSTVKGYSPTGGVTFYADSVSIGAATLTGGVGSITLSNLPVGTQSITANYGGDTNFNSGMSSPVNVTVVPDAAKISASVSPTAPTLGHPVSLTASVATTDGSTTPTGSFTFLVDGVQVGGNVSLSGGAASYSDSGLGYGSHQMVAIYSGDGNYSSGTSSTVRFSVFKQTPTVGLYSMTIMPSVDNPAALTISVTGSGPTPTGTVNISSGTSQLGQVTLAAGTASVSYDLAAGSYNLTASYSGDSNYAAATSAPYSLKIEQSPLSVSLGASASSVTLGQTVTVKVSLQDYVSAHTPGGNVAFFNNGQLLGTVGVAKAAASLAVSLPVGSNSIEAIYSGDLNYTGDNTNPITVTVSQAASATSVSASPYPDTLGQMLAVTAKVTSTVAGVSPTGMVTFYYAGSEIGTCPLSAGLATFSTSALPVGTAALSAQYSGDSNFLASTSNSPSLTVGKAKPALVLSASASSATQGTAISLYGTLTTVTAGSNPITPTGTVTFYSGSTNLGSVSVTTNPTTLTVSTLPVGNDSIHALYSGDSNYAAAESSSIFIVVSSASPAPSN